MKGKRGKRDENFLNIMRQRGYLIPVKFKPDDEVGDQRALNNSPSYGQEDFCHEWNVVVGADLCNVVVLD